MILVNARCSILPEKRAEFINEVHRIMAVVRKENGCIRYDLVSDVSDPDIFYFIEEWESKRHLDAHLERSHMIAYFAKTSACHSAPTDLTIYEIKSCETIKL